MSTFLLGSHAADDALVRMLDGEAGEQERRVVEAHLAECERCASRLAVLRHRSDTLTDLLARTAPAAPPFVPPDRTGVTPMEARRRRGPAAMGAHWLRAAAVAAVVLGIVASPLRARLVDWMQQGWEIVVAALGPEPSAPPSATLAEPATTRVRFPPPGPVLVLEAAPHPGGGTVVLARHASAEVEVTVGEGGNVVVLPAAVRLESAPGAAPGYRVVLPPGVVRVELRGPGGQVLHLDPREIAPGGERTIPLEPARR